MTVPSDPRDPRAARGAYGPADSPPTQPLPSALPPNQPAAYPAQPAAHGTEPAPVARRASTHVDVDTARYWAGVVATAIVAVLIGVVGVLVVEQILNVDLVVRDFFGTASHTAEYAWGGAVAALLAGLLLYLLALAAPRPTAFFGWIMALATLVAALLPFTWTSKTESAVATGLLNLVMGIAIWSLLSGALAWTSRVHTVV
jgi:hypothetical protein